MRYTLNVYLGILIGLTFNLGPAHASIMSSPKTVQFRHILEHAIERTRDFVKICSDSLTRPPPVLLARIEPVIPVYVPPPPRARKDPMEAFNRARHTFLEGFADKQKRFLVRAPLTILQPNDTQGLDYQSIKILTGKEFKEFTNAQYRDFVLMLIARSQRFESPLYTMNVFKLVIAGLAKRQHFDSTDVVRVQLAMLETANTFEDYQSLREGFAIIFSDWASVLRHPELIVLSRAVSDIIGTFDSNAERDAVLKIINDFENGLVDAF